MSTIPPHWTPELLAEVRRLAREGLEAKPLAEPAAPTRPARPEPVAGDGDRVLRAVAVVSRFHEDWARNLTSPPELERLVARSIEVHGTKGWRTLFPAVRNVVLQELDADELRRLLEANRVAGDPLQQAIADALRGLDRNALRTLPPAQLATLKQLYPGLSQCALPPLPDIHRALEMARLLEPMRELTRNFSGRAAELNVLREYVGVLPPQTMLGAAARVFNTALGIRRKAPLLIHGLGGVGKTTLAARFILDHVTGLPDDRLPFAYLDFDRPVVVAEQPATVVTEAVRQIGLQYDQASDAADRLYERLDHRFRSGHADERTFIRDFVSFLDTLQVRQGPVLLVLDTFEEVQTRSAVYTRNVVRFVNELAEQVPRLRTVILGRSDVPEARFEYRMELSEFDRESAIAYLIARGVDAVHAPAIIRGVGASPLALSMAAELYRRGEEPGFGTEPYFGSLRAGVQQAALFDRILFHVADPDVRKLVHPGLILRRITPAVIREILSGPCDVDVPTDERARELFDLLSCEVSLVNRVEADVLTPRSDIRRVMLPIVVNTSPTAVNEIHRRAVAFYSRRDDAVSRAEEIYHRLWLGESHEDIRSRLIPGLEPYLANALDELPLAARALLADAIGVEVPAEVRASADQETWERNASRSVSELLMTGDAARALQVLAERATRSANTNLRIQEVRALDANDLVERALTAAQEAIRAYDDAGNAPWLFDALLLAADLQWKLRNFDAAREYLLHAKPLAARDPLSLAMLLHRVIRMEALSRSEGVTALRQHLRDAVGAVTDAAWASHLDLLREIVAEIGMGAPELLARASRLGALELRQADLDTIDGLLADHGAERPREIDLVLPALVSSSAPRQLVRRTLASILGARPEAAEKPRRSTSSTLHGRQENLERLRDLLQRHYGDRLSTFVETRLQRSLESISFLRSVDRTSYDLVRAADRGGWLADLVIALVRSRFDSVEVQKLADALGIGLQLEPPDPRAGLNISDLQRLVDVRRGELGALEARTCTIRTNGKVLGCGVLIGSNVVLTVASVAAEIKYDVSFVFDRVIREGQVLDEGDVRSLLIPPVLDGGIALLCIDDQLAFFPIDRDRAEPSDDERGAVNLSAGVHALRSGTELIWLWRSGRGTHVTGARLPELAGAYPATIPVKAEVASAGSACIDQSGRIVALHGGPDPRDPRASLVLPVGEIVDAIIRVGFGDVLVPRRTAPAVTEDGVAERDRLVEMAPLRNALQRMFTGDTRILLVRTASAAETHHARNWIRAQPPAGMALIDIDLRAFSEQEVSASTLGAGLANALSLDLPLSLGETILSRRPRYFIDWLLGRADTLPTTAIVLHHFDSVALSPDALDLLTMLLRNARRLSALRFVLIGYNRELPAQLRDIERCVVPLERVSDLPETD